MNDVGGSLKEYWINQGVRLCPGANEQEIKAFETKHGLNLPSDFRQYLTAVNGFDGSTHWSADDDVVTFLGLSEISTVSEYWSAELEDANDYFVFADYMLSAWVYAIRLRVPAGGENAVVVVGDRLLKLANSFTSFVESYIENSQEILFR